MKYSSYWEQFRHEADNESFWMGVYEGIKAYAVWKDGTQYVGILEKPLKEVLEEIEQLRYKWAKESSFLKWEKEGR